jgi:hypothetical protein
MNSDDAVRQVFNSEVLGVQDRMPDSDEVARALLTRPDRSRSPLQRALHDFLPAASLAAACFVAVVSGLPGSGFARPLASELTRTIPADAGDTFIVLLVATGDYFRSADR